MSRLDKEANFFKEISEKILEHVTNSLKDNKIVKNKGQEGDFATAIDVSIENLIIDEIKNLFPNDEVMAEEGHSETNIGDKRIWVIDPICGTNNLGRNIPMYCTNIALVDGGKVISACVVDFSAQEYYWSVGEQKVYKADKHFTRNKDDLGIVVDLDFGAADGYEKVRKERLMKAAKKIVVNTSYQTTSFNSSLSFLFAAIGKLEGLINIHANPWDQFAGAFLAQQMGNVVTDIDGNPWTIHAGNLVVARDNEIHATLIKALALTD